MATFKAVVRKKRADGFYPVYIRIVHRSRMGYIKTDKLITDKQILKSGEIKDAVVNEYCSREILKYTDMANRKDISEYSVSELIEYICSQVNISNSKLITLFYMKRKCITIAISNQKGGVGKTSSTACIGAALALQGKRILLVDLDAQQNLTFTLTQNEDPETSIYDALVKDKPLPIVPIRKNLDLVPASLDLARAEIDMATMMAREGILKSHLDGQKEKYDYILMDCSPSLGIVTTNALVAADKLYIPLTAEALPLKGLTMLDDIVSEVKRRVNPKLELGGVFFTRFNNRKLNKEVMNMVKNRYGDKVFQTKIRENIAIAEMPLSGQTLFEYDPKSNGAADYKTLTEEIISREENR